MNTWLRREGVVKEWEGESVEGEGGGQVSGAGLRQALGGCGVRGGAGDLRKNMVVGKGGRAVAVTRVSNLVPHGVRLPVPHSHVLTCVPPVLSGFWLMRLHRACQRWRSSLYLLSFLSFVGAYSNCSCLQLSSLDFNMDKGECKWDHFRLAVPQFHGMHVPVTARQGFESRSFQVYKHLFFPHFPSEHVPPTHAQANRKTNSFQRARTRRVLMRARSLHIQDGFDTIISR